jgi:WD40 repeat protein
LVKKLRGPTAAVHCVKFSPDSTKLCSGSADKTARVWELPTGKLVAAAQTGAEVNAVTWLADNEQLASGGSDDIVRMWKLDSSKEGLALVKELRGHEDSVAALESVPSTATQILSGGADGSLRLWDVADGKTVRLMKHGGPITAIAVRRDGKRFASAGLDKTVRLWDPAEGKQLAELKGDRYARERAAELERAVTFAKSEVEFRKGALKSAETNQTAQAQRVKKATEASEAAQKAFAEKEGKVKEAAEAKAAAEKALDDLKAELKKANDALAEADKSAKRAETEAKSIKEDATATKERIESAAVAAAVQAKAATEARDAADKLAADTKEKEKQATEKTNAAKKSLEETEKALKKAETTKSSAETELTLATRAAEQAANAVTEANEAIQRAEDEHQDTDSELETARKTSADSELPVRCVAFSPDNLTLATGGDDQVIHTWSAGNGAPFDEFAGQKGPILALTFVGTNHVLSGAADRSVMSWNLQTVWPLARVIGTGDANSPMIDRVNALAFSPDGQTLATGGGEPSRSGEIKLWHVGTGRLLHSFTNVHSDVVFGLDFSRDGKFLASSAADRFVKVLDLTSGKVVKQFEGHTHHVLGVSWKRDGRTLASSGADNVIKLWDFISGDRKRNVGGFDKEVTSVHFVGYTDQMLAASGDSKIRLVREDGNEVRSFAGAGDFVHSAAATPDGKMVIAGGQDSILRVWDGASGKVLATFPAPQKK